MFLKRHKKLLISVAVIGVLLGNLLIPSSQLLFQTKIKSYTKEIYSFIAELEEFAQEKSATRVMISSKPVWMSEVYPHNARFSLSYWSDYGNNRIRVEDPVLEAKINSTMRLFHLKSVTLNDQGVLMCSRRYHAIIVKKMGQFPFLEDVKKYVHLQDKIYYAEMKSSLDFEQEND